MLERYQLPWVRAPNRMHQGALIIVEIPTHCLQMNAPIARALRQADYRFRMPRRWHATATTIEEHRTPCASCKARTENPTEKGANHFWPRRGCLAPRSPHP